MTISIAEAVREVERFKTLFRALEKIEDVLLAVRTAEQTIREKNDLVEKSNAAAAVAVAEADRASQSLASVVSKLSDAEAAIAAKSKELSALLAESSRIAAANNSKEATLKQLDLAIAERSTHLKTLEEKVSDAERRAASAERALEALRLKVG